MKRSYPHLLVGLVVSLATGCPDRPVDDAGGDPTSATTTIASGTETSDGASGTGTTEPCPEGTERCADTCSSLRQDQYNCGECGRVCPLAEYGPGGCDFYGECVPAGSPCVHPDDGIPTCEALCNTVGQHCAGDIHWMWFSSQEDASCGYKTQSTTTYDAACDDPFAWDKIGGFGEPAVAARCKCTNNF